MIGSSRKFSQRCAISVDKEVPDSDRIYTGSVRLNGDQCFASTFIFSYSICGGGPGLAVNLYSLPVPAQSRVTPPPAQFSDALFLFYFLKSSSSKFISVGRFI